MNTSHSDERSAARRCHFDLLAARSELHSIMQMLDRHSLLQLARCSRRMHATADSDAAWKTQPPFEVRLEQGTGTVVAARIRRSLVSHVAATRICPREADHQGTVQLLEEDIDAMLTLPRITQIIEEWRVIPADEWHRILHHPAVASLTKLTTRYNVPQGIIGHLVHLPRLHTLDAPAYMLVPPFIDGPAIDATPLSSLPALTSLGVRALNDETRSLLPAIAACTQLKQLRLPDAIFNKGEFRRLFTSPNLSRLRRLELDGISVSGPPAEYATAFAAMAHLRHLKLRVLYDLDPILPGVASAPHLGTLDLTCPPPPSVAALRTFLTRSRAKVIMRLPPSIPSRRFAAINSRRLRMLPIVE